MRKGGRRALLQRALWEMVRFDLMYRLGGLARVRRAMSGGRARIGALQPDAASVCRAVECMCSFYWKPLLCLQRAVVTARVLRATGIQADVVIGYRASPFLSHAWVEMGGRVLNDPPAYQHKLQIIDRF